MKKSIYKIVLCSLFFLAFALITLPIAYSKTGNNINPSDKIFLLTVNSGKVSGNEKTNFSALYFRMNLSEKGLTQQAFDYAVKGYEYLKRKGKISDSNVISIADFSLSSAKKRLFIIDLDKEEILFNSLVAHGQKTGSEYATTFSNRPESYQSSPGFYITSGTYNGKNGYSMHLEGQEVGINDKAGERAIVMHGAPYVSENFIKSRGFIGRSWGCPAVPENLNKPIIETIKNGTCLFIYTNDNRYLSVSKILNS